MSAWDKHLGVKRVYIGKNLQGDIFVEGHMSDVGERIVLSYQNGKQEIRLYFNAHEAEGLATMLSGAVKEVRKAEAVPQRAAPR